MSSELKKLTHWFIVVAEFLDTKEKLALQLVSKKFYDRVIPMTMRNLDIHPRLPREQLVLNLIAGVNLKNARVLFDQIIKDTRVSLDKNEWPNTTRMTEFSSYFKYIHKERIVRREGYMEIMFKLNGLIVIEI